jgi:dihydroorotate dehydrogenase (NAD+) catalytic subunit
MGIKNKGCLEVNIGSIKMQNPVMVASGTFGYGEEYSELVDINKLGAVVTKTITLEPREGNPPPRMIETPSGMINSIGLQNVGVEEFVDKKLPFLKKFKARIIVSIAGNTVEEYAQLASILDKEKIDGIELNISCPNVMHAGGKTLFAQDAAITDELVHKARKATSLPLIIKLSPNVTDIVEIAVRAEDAGADALSLVNTFQAMAVKINNGGVSKIITGGLSGPAIKPIALRMVWEVAHNVEIPVIGMGGIMDVEDAIEFLIAGASAVAVGTAMFINPQAPVKIIAGIEEYLRKNKLGSVRELQERNNRR